MVLAGTPKSSSATWAAAAQDPQFRAEMEEIARGFARIET
jgi:hypothetical protein